MQPPGPIVGWLGDGAAALSAVLRQAGFCVVEGSGPGAEALILDGALPQAPALCAARLLPVIEVVNGAPHEGASAYLTPPVSPAVAVAAVNAVLRHFRTAEPAGREAVRRLAAGLAHRLNNSLTEVLGNIGFALDALDQRNPAREPLEVAAEACTSMASLTRDLLAYAGKSLSFMRPVDLAALVAALPLAQLVAAPVRLELEFEPGVLPVEGDGDQLGRLATHLVKNAAEAITPGAPGAVTVALAVRELAAGDLRGFQGHEDLQPGPYVCLRVTDSGCGMDAATLPLIFDPFFSTKFVGRGLGLASVLGAVRAHRGGIQVDSAPGKGTSVTVCIPARR